MTREEFGVHYTRLCARYGWLPSDEQARVWYSRFGHQSVKAWDWAVDALIAETRPPNLDSVLRAVEQQVDELRRSHVQIARRQGWGAYDRTPKASDPVAFAYGCMRLAALKRALGGDFARVLAESLMAWLDDPVNAAWARDTRVEDCGCLEAPHSLLHCLTAEIQRYEATAAVG